MKKLVMLGLILMISMVGVVAASDACDDAKQCVKDNYGQEGEFACDFNNDSVINLRDVSLYARHYQEEGWCETYFPQEECITQVTNQYTTISSGGSGFSMAGLVRKLSDKTGEAYEYLTGLFVLRTEMNKKLRLMADDMCYDKYDMSQYIETEKCIAEKYERYGLN